MFSIKKLKKMQKELESQLDEETVRLAHDEAERRVIERKAEIIDKMSRLKNPKDILKIVWDVGQGASKDVMKRRLDKIKDDSREDDSGENYDSKT